MGLIPVLQRRAKAGVVDSRSQPKASAIAFIETPVAFRNPLCANQGIVDFNPAPSAVKISPIPVTLSA